MLTGLGRSSIVKIVRLFEILVVHFIQKLAKIRTFILFYEEIRFVLQMLEIGAESTNAERFQNCISG